MLSQERDLLDNRWIHLLDNSNGTEDLRTKCLFRLSSRCFKISDNIAHPYLKVK